MNLTPGQVRCFKKGVECCNDVRPTIAYLKQIAAAAPEYADRVQELDDMAEHLEAVCKVGLTAAGVDPAK